MRSSFWARLLTSFGVGSLSTLNRDQTKLLLKLSLPGNNSESRFIRSISILKTCWLSVSPCSLFHHADGFDSALIVVWKTARHSSFIIRQTVAQL